MIGIRTIKIKKFIIIIISKKKINIEYLITNTKTKLDRVIHFQNGLYKAICYGERTNKNFQIINPTYVLSDTWVYEYHDREGYVYNQFEYKKLKVINLAIITDILYRTGPVSLDEALLIILRKRIFFLDSDILSKLLEIENSKLFVSMVDILIDFYTNSDLLKDINLNYLARLNQKIDYMLYDIKDYHSYFYKLSHLTFNQFVLVMKENKNI